MRKALAVERQHRRNAAAGLTVAVLLLLVLLWPRAGPVSHHQHRNEVGTTPTTPVSTLPSSPQQMIRLGGVPDDDDQQQQQGASDVSLSPAGSQQLQVHFIMSNAMSSAWRSSSERLTFPTRITMSKGGRPLTTREGGLEAAATFYGKSSIKLRYTKRRSLHLRLSEPVSLDSGPQMTEVLLLSLWEDEYRIAYRSSVELLRQLGVFHSYARLVELTCGALKTSGASGDDENYCRHGDTTLGAYLWIEYPSEALARGLHEEVLQPKKRPCEPQQLFEQRMALFQRIRESLGITSNLDENTRRHIEVGTRNYFYFERPKRYDILHVPSYKRNSTIAPFYATIERDPLGTAITASTAASATDRIFDLNQYLTWLAVNSILMNGDYDDEVFFYQIGNVVGIMAWDYDTIFAPCHRKPAVPSDVMYCAETPIEAKTLSNPSLMAMYRDVLQCTLNHVATPERWSSIVQSSLGELKPILARNTQVAKMTFSEAKSVPDVEMGGAALVKKFTERHETLSRLAASSGVAAEDNGGRSTLESADTAGKRARGAEKEAPCSASELRKAVVQTAGFQKKAPREHKAGRGQMSLAGVVGTAFVERAIISLPLQPGKDTFETRSVTASEPSMQLSEPGLYCVRMIPPPTSRCQSGGASPRSGDGIRPVFFDYPVVLRSLERGAAEFALPHYTKPRIVATLNIDERVAATTLRALTPFKWVWGHWFPAVVRLAHDGHWSRENVPLQFVDSTQHQTMLIRGFCAVKMRVRGEVPESVDGPLLPWPHAISDGGTATVRLAVGGASPTVEVHAPRHSVSPDELSRMDPLPSFRGVSNVMGDACVLLLEGDMTLEADRTLTVGAGCLIVLKEGAQWIIHGKVVLQGTTERPITVTSTSEESPWQSIVVAGAKASVEMSFTFVVGSGVRGKTHPHTGKHHKHSAAFTVVDGAFFTAVDCYFLQLQGPAVAAGSKGSVSVSRSVVQWTELGIECVQCDFSTSGSTWANFPNWDVDYRDDDNDAMYVSGGIHRVSDSVIAHAKDDCVDSGTPEKSSGDGGSLTISNTIVEYCQHEGIALSSSPKGERSVTLDHIVVQHCQQGVESGYSGKKHIAVLRNVHVSDTVVALRFGDNYYNRPQHGDLRASHVVLARNTINALNYVRGLGGPQFTSAFTVDSKSSQLFVDNHTIADLALVENQRNDPASGVTSSSPLCFDMFQVGQPNQDRSVRPPLHHEMLTEVKL